MNNLPALSLVIGGAASGKSDFAERLVTGASTSRCYIATGQAFDAEMAAKIARHKKTRENGGWKTIEEPVALAEALSNCSDGASILIDCATMWLSNLLMAKADLEAETSRLLAALGSTQHRIVIVSNETGQGIVPDNKLARQFRQEQGQLNRRLAAQAELVVQVTVGLPQVLKGALPEGVQ